jgi:hypothetical protein
MTPVGWRLPVVNGECLMTSRRLQRNRFGVSLPIGRDLIVFDREAGTVKEVLEQGEMDLLLHGSREQSLAQFLRIFGLSEEAQSARPA